MTPFPVLLGLLMLIAGSAAAKENPPDPKALVRVELQAYRSGCIECAADGFKIVSAHEVTAALARAQATDVTSSSVVAQNGALVPVVVEKDVKRYPARMTRTDSPDGSGSETIEYKLVPTEGFYADVVPLALRNGEILVDLHIKRTRLLELRTPKGSPISFPEVAQSEVHQKLRVKDGQTTLFQSADRGEALHVVLRVARATE